jgi:hypothetical protein
MNLSSTIASLFWYIVESYIIIIIIIIAKNIAEEK